LYPLVVVSCESYIPIHYIIILHMSAVYYARGDKSFYTGINTINILYNILYHLYIGTLSHIHIYIIYLYIGRQVPSSVYLIKREEIRARAA